MRIVKPILLFVIVMLSSLTLVAATNQPFQPMQKSVGITFGTPAGLNLVGTYFAKNQYGARISGAHIPGPGDEYIAGVQFSFLRRLYEVHDGGVDISLLAGYSESVIDFEFDKWTYMGVAWAFRWKRLFIETGLTFGTGTYESPQFGLQTGVLLYRGRRH